MASKKTPSSQVAVPLQDLANMLNDTKNHLPPFNRKINLAFQKGTGSIMYDEKQIKQLTRAQKIAIGELLGFSLEYDNSGQCVFYTGFKDPRPE